MTSVGRQLTTAVTLPIAGLAAKSVQLAGEFEKTMNTMRSVAGVPGPELKKLDALALKLGRDTVFSANEAAQAMLELAKAGVSTSDILGGGLKQTLSLATAGDLELADAATIAANAMNVFQIKGNDAQVAMDALAGAANASSANVSDIAEALAQGGNAAASAGFSIQEATAALAAFSQNGIRGSDAGTSLKTMLLRLVPTSLRAKEAMKGLGLSFVDGSGHIMGLTDIADTLQKKLKGLTQAERQAALQVIFGTDAYRAANVLYREGAEGLQAYIEETSKSGNAADVAKAKMKGWAGTLEQLRGSLETVGLQIGRILIPVFTKLARWATEVTNRFQSLSKAQQETIIKIAAFAAAVGPAIYIVGKLSLIVKGLGVALSFLVAHPVIAAIAAIAAGMIYAYKQSASFRDTIQKLWAAMGRLWEAVQPLANAIGKVLAGAFKILEPILTLQLKTLTALINSYARAIELAGQLGGFLQGDLSDEVGSLVGQVQAQQVGANAGTRPTTGNTVSGKPQLRTTNVIVLDGKRIQSQTRRSSVLLTGN